MAVVNAKKVHRYNALCIAFRFRIIKCGETLNPVLHFFSHSAYGKKTYRSRILQIEAMPITKQHLMGAFASCWCRCSSTCSDHLYAMYELQQSLTIELYIYRSSSNQMTYQTCHYMTIIRHSMLVPTIDFYIVLVTSVDFSFTWIDMTI